MPNEEGSGEGYTARGATVSGSICPRPPQQASAAEMAMRAGRNFWWGGGSGYLSLTDIWRVTDADDGH